MLRSMKSALGLILGVSVFALLAGCDNGGDEDGTGGSGPQVAGTNATAGTPATGGTGVIPMGGTGTGGTGTATEGVPLTPTDGWVDAASNTLMIQGAMFEYADPTSLMGLMPDFVGTHACIKGTAAKVDMASMACATKTFTPPATDCYGEYWGAAIGLNLNQPIDPVTEMGADPMPFNASAIKGFSFKISGTAVPVSLRFKVEDASGEFCSPKTVPVKLGENTIMLSQLIKECWKPVATAANADSAKSALIKIAWQVVTDTTASIPFDYCVEELRAVTQ
jgi:hypothetical protein